jgi:hypothetical protein
VLLNHEAGRALPVPAAAPRLGGLVEVAFRAVGA